MGTSNAKFLEIWMDSYRNFRNSCWGCNSVLMASKLAELFPHHIHVELKSFTHPTYSAFNAMYGTKVYNFTNNYSIHIYNHYKQHVIPSNEEELRGYNCTLGNVMRYVLYGCPDLLETENVWNGYI